MILRAHEIHKHPAGPKRKIDQKMHRLAPNLPDAGKLAAAWMKLRHVSGDGFQNPPINDK